MYDYLVVGSGLYGSIFAREATNKGYKVLVIDKRNNVGGSFKSWYDVDHIFYGSINILMGSPS